MENTFEGKNIIVTGGAGSIGSHIVKSLLKFEPKQVRVFDNRETELFFLKEELLDYTDTVRFLVGDVRDKERLNRAMQGIDIVFHAAALKHVPLCEYNPFEATKTNVGGTQNVIETALDNNVERVINISTDKAISPINTMGATKLLAEKLIVAANLFRGNKKTAFSTVRFGNVIGSNGSVIELLKKQIADSGKVTITNPNMTRFVMSIQNAVDLILEAARIMQGSEIFILKMPALKLQDLADVIIKERAGDREIKVEETGIRVGEKMHESLMTEEETQIALETDKMYVIPPPEKAKAKVGGKELKSAKSRDRKELDSGKAGLLKKDEIRQVLREAGVI